MRIDSQIRPPYVVELSRPAAARQETAPARAPVKSFDRVEISAQTRELSKLRKELAALPDVRPERVALARQQMQYGPYRVDPVALAQKMLGEQQVQGDDL